MNRYERTEEYMNANLKFNTRVLLGILILRRWSCPMKLQKQFVFFNKPSN